MLGIYGVPDSVEPKRNYPITPKENMLRMLRGEMPLWVPNQTTDNNAIQPMVMPYATARAFGGTDWFGIEWEYEPLTKAAMVKPGTRRLSDITQWESEIIWPDLKAIDWQKDYEDNYKDRIADDRFSYFVIVNGLFERTADLTSFEDTFCYLLEEPEALTAFFDKLVDWHIELIHIAKEVYHADMILFHDDMGTQISTFFSPNTYRELFLPQYQKITKSAHDLGMFVCLHSCGNVGTLMSLFIEAGFDDWEGQDSANDKDSIMSEYGVDLAQCTLYIVPADLSDEDAVADIHKRVDELATTGRFACRLRDEKTDRKINLAEELYRYSRQKYLDLNG
ncbi:uroporphyrinogen decarboxylase family protein [Eubacterium aggregans]|uniref:uroporphyrinogen decarboxylase family protein n=1 Tax=Eubacterium aggregans TaxID=81409 RepID=UPI003F3B013B